MHTLQWTFTFLTICGCMPPSSWTTTPRKLLYHFYTTLAWLFIHTLMCTQILDIVFNVDNTDDFSDNLYMTLVTLLSACKITILLMRRKSILSLFETLHKEPFIPLNVEEKKIQTRYNNTIEWSAIIYMTLVELSASWMYVRSYFTDFKNRTLTFRAWLPYEYSVFLPYMFTYACQLISSILCAFLNVGCDSLFSGMLIHIYCQFEILEERLKNTQGDKSYTVKQCANHHFHIYKFAKMVNEEFKVIMLCQFCISTAVVCFNLYRMTHVTLISKLIEAALYAACVLTEILYYCWYSNEVKLKSLEVPSIIFRSNWETWDNKAKKIGLMIMKRAAEPIEFSSIYLVSFNLNSFMALMKTSYSVFNLMQQPRK